MLYRSIKTTSCALH